MVIFFQRNNLYVSEEELSDEPKPNYIWIHISCVQFIPELHFGDKIQMTNILGKFFRKQIYYLKGLENIDKSRFGMECDVCKDKSNF